MCLRLINQQVDLPLAVSMSASKVIKTVGDRNAYRQRRRQIFVGWCAATAMALLLVGLAQSVRARTVSRGPWRPRGVGFNRARQWRDREGLLHH